MFSRNNVLIVPTILFLHFTSGLYKLPEGNVNDVRDGATNICVNTVGNQNINHLTNSNEGPEDGLNRQPYQRCENTTTTNYCFTVWKESPADGSIQVLKQGNVYFHKYYLAIVFLLNWKGTLWEQFENIPYTI